MNKEYIKLMERALRLNRLIASRGLPVVLVLTHYGSIGVNWYLTRFDDRKQDFEPTPTNSDQEVIEAAIKLMEPRWTEVTTTCIELLNKPNIYHNKEVEVLIVSITVDGCITSGGTIIPPDELYLKE